jgi:hypothetical protein
MKKQTLSIAFMVTGFTFSLIETAYFGFNWLPSCRAELICDIFCGVLIVIGIIIYDKTRLKSL